MYQQFPPQQQTPNPQYQHPPQQQQFRQPAPFQHSPSFNMGRFDTNSQTAAAPNQNPPFPPSSFNAEMLKQLANSSIPPPPPPNFPPVPIPNMNYTQFLQTTNAAQPPFPPPPAAVPSNADQADDYDPRYPNQMLYNSRVEPSHHSQNQNNPFAPRREEGSSSSKTVSQEGYPHEVADPRPQSQHDLNLDRSIFSSLIRPPEPGSIQRQDSSWQGNSGIQSHPEASKSQRSSFEDHVPASTGQAFVKPDSILKPEQTSNKAVNSPSAHAPALAVSAAPTDEKSLPELRESAKAALLSLVPHNISFAQVVKEDINTDLLRKLYGELGIDVDANQPEAAPEPSQPAISDPSAATNSSLTVPGADPAINEITRPPPAPSPSLERKDRIAQLLAAKTGRPSPVRTVSESVASTGTSELRQREESQVEALPYKEQPADQFNANKMATTQAGTEQAGMSISKTVDIPLQISTQKAVQEPVQASPMSAIPGLFMTSLDPVQTGGTLMQSLQALAQDSDSARSPQKRPLEADEQMNNERTAKRRNTDASGVAMDIDDSDYDASEGEVSEDETNLQKEPQVAPDNALPSAPIGLTSFGGATTIEPPAPSVSGQNTFSTPSKTRLTSAQLAEKAEMLKARFLKQRAERQKQLQEGLPDLEAEVQKTRSQLAKQQAQLLEVRQQIGKLELEASQARDSERNLVEEITKLEKNLTEGVSGQNKYADELNELNGDPNAASSTTAIATSPAEPVEDDRDRSTDPIADHADEEGAAEETQPGSLRRGESDRSNSTTSMQMDVELEEPAPERDESPAAIEVSDSAPQEVKVPTYGPDELDSMYAGIEPEIDETQPASQQVGDQENGGEILDYKSDGSASMSDSGSEVGQDEEMDYEPVEADPSHPMDLEVSDDEEYDPESVNVSPPGNVVEAGGEKEYEPSPAEPEDGAIATPSSGEVIEVSSTAIDAAPALDNQQAFAETKPAVQEVDMSNADQNSLIIGSDITGTLHTDPLPPAQRKAVQAKVADTQQVPLTNSAATNGTSIGYTPYQSPLSSFQSFRYHEQFSKEPPKDGYRSLTYSNNIDPAVPLCLTELAGGVCQDPMCSEQHFRHLGLSGMAPG
jgi:hypothetical protein